MDISSSSFNIQKGELINNMKEGKSGIKTEVVKV